MKFLVIFIFFDRIDFENFSKSFSEAIKMRTQPVCFLIPIFLGLIEALLIRFKRRMRPFGIATTSNPIELLLSDGFYAVFHKRWQEYFPDEQLLVVDGTKFCKCEFCK